MSLNILEGDKGLDCYLDEHRLHYYSGKIGDHMAIRSGEVGFEEVLTLP